MNSLELLRMALRNLFKRKLRTLLTVSGVVIGTAAIVVMISLGLGVNAAFSQMAESMGDATVIQLYNYDYYYNKIGTKLDDEMMTAIRAIPGVTEATPMLSTYLTAKSGRYTANIQIYGVEPGSLEAFGWKVTEESGTLTGEKKWEIVFGSDTPSSFMSQRQRKEQEAMYSGGYVVYYDDSSTSDGTELNVDIFNDKFQASYANGFGSSSGTGAENTGSSGNSAKPYTLNVVGVFSTDNSSWMTSYYSFMNIDDVKQIVKDREKYERTLNSQGSSSSQLDNGYEEAYIKCTSLDEVEAVTAQLELLGFTSYYSPMDTVNSLQSFSGTLQLVLGAIGGVSFIVAAIGIANTMVMSIYERTREIGVMKVVGASIKDILMLFLTEAGLIGVFGGVFGLGVSYGISYLINTLIGASFLTDMFYYMDGSTSISIIPPWLCIVAVVFSFFVGVLSGLFPAIRATRISALAAIKTD